MTPERWQQVKELLDGALDLPPTEQDAWLGRACAGDDSLRRQVQALLGLRSESTNFLEVPAASLLPREPQVPSAMRRRRSGKSLRSIGPYKLLRRIGRGGMGTVYLAEREDAFKKKVAIKLVAHDSDSETIVWRFERERQILAQLEHPGIARLLDGGSTANGRPYFVMEYVEGDPVCRYCDRYDLAIEQRLELFRRICSTVAFAHRNLVIHRDIKPANILVSSEGEPKLLDFGIAKLIPPRDATTEDLGNTSHQVMTPAYASPEQLRKEVVTTASDVFSLGVLLHELLTGKRPLRSGFYLLSEECLEDPRATRELDGDLGAIVDKALALEPAERYSSVERFSEDVGRYLENLPVLARTGEPGYTAGRFLRRNTMPLAAASLFLCLLGGFALHTQRQAAELTQVLKVNREMVSILRLGCVDAYPTGISRSSLTSDTGQEVLTCAEMRHRIDELLKKIKEP